MKNLNARLLYLCTLQETLFDLENFKKKYGDILHSFIIQTDSSDGHGLKFTFQKGRTSPTIQPFGLQFKEGTYLEFIKRSKLLDNHQKLYGEQVLKELSLEKAALNLCTILTKKHLITPLEFFQYDSLELLIRDLPNQNQNYILCLNNENLDEMIRQLTLEIQEGCSDFKGLLKKVSKLLK